MCNYWSHHPQFCCWHCHFYILTGQQQLQSHFFPSTLLRVAIPGPDVLVDNSPTPTEACKSSHHNRIAAQWQGCICERIFRITHIYISHGPLLDDTKSNVPWHQFSPYNWDVLLSFVLITTDLHPKLFNTKTGNYKHHSSSHNMITIHCYTITTKDPLFHLYHLWSFVWYSKINDLERKNKYIKDINKDSFIQKINMKLKTVLLQKLTIHNLPQYCTQHVPFLKLTHYSGLSMHMPV
jgi:hypothetical protein